MASSGQGERIQRTRIGILGAGGMAQTHVSRFGLIKAVEIAGICSRVKAHAESIAKPLGVPATADPRRLLEDDSIDAIDVVVPSGAHRRLAIEALERGKHVFCETPIALNLEDADEMIRAARRHHRLLLVAQLARFVPEYARIHKAAISNEFGRPLLGLASRLSPPYWTVESPRPFQSYGEPLVELMIFDFNYLNWIFGFPTSVYAGGLTGARGRPDHILVTLHYPGGIGFAEGSARMPTSFPFNTHLRVLFGEAMIEADFRILPKKLTWSLTLYPEKGKPRILKAPGSDPYRAECQYFVDCVRGNADPSLMDAVHDRNALRVALAARESLRRKSTVRLAE